MKITAILMLAACLQVGATGYTQTVSLSVKDAQLETVFQQIRKQTGYNFIFTREVISAANPVNINVQNASLQDVLEICFQNQPLSFTIAEKFIVIKQKILKSSIEDPNDPSIDIRGKVLNNNGEPIGGATVAIKNTKQATATNERGEFFLPVVDENATLIISSIGHKTMEVKVQGRSVIEISMEVSVSSLDETVVIAYGTTTRRLNTGSVGRVTAKEIETQPVSNPLAALQGRVPGLIITQSSGVPGASFSVQIRGRSSLDLNISQNDPLFIIDGVPFEPGNTSTNQIVSAANNPISTSKGGLSPLNSINPMDIESIEVLKDADATAIYGSRGANGVILITTKNGATGKTKVTFNVYTGWSKITRMPDMMNTRQYIDMRKEAFANDSIVMTNSNAPDLLLWDTTRYTDFKNILVGGTAHSNDVQLSVSGGNSNTSFLLSNSFRKETTVFPGDLSDQRASFNLSVKHLSENKRFITAVNGIFSNDVNRLISIDPSQYMRLPPHLKLYDSLGNLNWEEGGVYFSNFNSFSNPLAQFERKYNSTTELFSGNLNTSYEVIPGMIVRVNAGYNIFATDEKSVWPQAAISPNSSTLPSSRFANSKTKSWILEPQLKYDFDLLNGKASLLVGSTFQEKNNNRIAISARNFSSDLLLYSISAAADVNIDNNSSKYRYTALFGRWNYNWQNKYILNLSGRRDGSSRFAPKNRFENFWSTGLAWIFTNENFMQKVAHILSFGKIRGSYGLTGNDQIGDYKYLDLWRNTTLNFQNSSGLFPVGLFNPDYRWEKNKKMEIALEVGFWQDRLLFSTAFYRHRSSNQLVNYNLPIQSGFPTIVKNLPALVQNTGLEISISKKSQIGDISLLTSLNVTMPRNKLISFPGLEESSYFSAYEVGQPLSVIKRINYLGVDPQTGNYTFEDLNHDGLFSGADYQSLGNTDPKLFGGLENQIQYKSFNLSFLFQGSKQTGINYLDYFYNFIPGTGINQPLFALSRWQMPGDISDLPQFTAVPSNQVAIASRTIFRASNGAFSDASFIRLKNISLSYTISRAKFKRFPFDGGRVFINAQNLLTISKYRGSDPESQSIIQLPPLKTIVGGIQITF